MRRTWRRTTVVALRAGDDGRPGPAVVRHAEDHLGRRDAADVGGQGVGQVVDRSADRRDRAGGPRRAGLVVVAHDHDRVGAARGGRRLDRVVADPAHRVEGELVARGDRVELRPDRLDERGELVGVGRRDRLEVEVDAVGATIADGRRDLAGEVVAGGRAAQQRLLACRARSRSRRSSGRSGRPVRRWRGRR